MTGASDDTSRTGPDGILDAVGEDRIAVPLSFLLWGLVVIALAYGVFSTLTKVVSLFS